MIELLVLGIGSPFGDDQLGFDVIKRLEQASSLQSLIPHRLQLTAVDRPGLQLLELMQTAQTVFLVDAVKTGSPPGTLHCFQNEEIEAVEKVVLSTHDLGLGYAMKMGAALNILPKTVLLYGIEMNELQDSLTISPPIIKAINALSIQLEKAILDLYV